MTETETTKAISNDTVQMYFFVMFGIVIVLTAISVAGDLMVALRKPALGMGLLLRSAPTLIIAVANAMFLYILSSRALPSTERSSKN